MIPPVAAIAKGVWRLWSGAVRGSESSGETRLGSAIPIEHYFIVLRNATTSLKLSVLQPASNPCGMTELKSPRRCLTSGPETERISPVGSISMTVPSFLEQIGPWHRSGDPRGLRLWN